MRCACKFNVKCQSVNGGLYMHIHTERKSVVFSEYEWIRYEGGIGGASAIHSDGIRLLVCLNITRMAERFAFQWIL